MDIEYNIECAHDFLEISEGVDRLAVIHRYCTEQGRGDGLNARFRTVKSTGRELTLFFKTDSAITRHGFNIEYEFVKFEESGKNYCSKIQQNQLLWHKNNK